MTKAEVLEIIKKEKVRFLRLQFTDILGVVKNVEVPESQVEKALDGEMLFDGSSIQGFVRIEESDMLLKTDLDSFAVYPWDVVDIHGEVGRVGRLICDIYNADETPFKGCPRLVLKRICDEARDMGFTMHVGPEAEFFLFLTEEDGSATTQTHDTGGYFDLAPLDKGEECRREIVNVLESMGFEVEAAHHEVAPGQHEIDFKHGDAVTTADRLSTFRWVVRKVAVDYGLHATFMPKPLFGQNGSGMHCHQSLFMNGSNAFFDPEGQWELSDTARYYLAGLMEHAKGLTAITNPLVNSYKRIVPGYEAPTQISWSERNRSPLVRVPARRGVGTRVEIRSPDPACNPYLAFAVMLAAGLDGIKKKMDPPDPVSKNIFKMSQRERARHKIHALPANLNEAITCLKKDKIMSDALGPHILEHFVAAKQMEWNEYRATVHSWEVDRYLTAY